MASQLSSKSSESNSSTVPAAKPRIPFLAVSLPLAALILVSDRITKSWAESTLGGIPGNSMQVIGNWVRFSLSHNSGAAFSTFQGGQTLLYVVIAAVIVVVGYGYYRYLPRDKWLLQVCVGLQLGGALGNLIDRFQHVYVIDFIDVGVGDHRWPWFNIADSAIVVGHHHPGRLPHAQA